MMPLDFDASTGAMELTDPGDGHIVTSTGRRMVNLIKPAAFTASGVSIVFPNPTHDHAYGFFSTSSPFPQDVCDSFATILPGEWGPGRANNLSAATLGTVPAGTDYLDVQVNLTRTVAPSQRLGFTIEVVPAQGQWISLPSGSCLLENDGVICRGFEVALSGANVVLNRYQTVVSTTVFTWRPGNASGLAQHGWTHGGSGVNGIPVHHIDSKNAGAAIGKYKTGGANACSLSDPTNYGATYSATFKITPGRYQS